MKPGEPSPERLHPRWFIVPRSPSHRPPAGLTYAAPMLRRVVGPGLPSFDLNETLWGPEVALQVHSILILPAVSALARWDWGARVMGSPELLTSKAPRVFRWWPRDRARIVNTQNRTGEVLIWPLMAIPSNQPQPT